MLTLEEIKQIEIGILDYIVSICNKHNINYYLSYGTLLGAIRHQGFIPWDDDIDISLLRPDYDKLLSVLASENNNRYKLLYPNMDDYYYTYAKVVDTKTKILENSISDIKEMGIWVDIFPLDGIKGKKTWHSIYLYLLNKCRAASIYRKFPSDKYNIIMYLPWIFCKCLGYNYFQTKIIKESLRYSIDEVPFVSHATEAYSYCIPKDIMKESTKVLFEGKYYSAPSNYEKYLEIHYNDYMKLPPIENRINHCVKAILK